MYNLTNSVKESSETPKTITDKEYLFLTPEKRRLYSRPRGFAAMSPDKQKEIASKGGKASSGGGRKPWKNL